MSNPDSKQPSDIPLLFVAAVAGLIGLFGGMYVEVHRIADQKPPLCLCHALHPPVVGLGSAP
jgi:hypothetical protein